MARDLKPIKSSQHRKTYGLCELCGERVLGSDQHIIAEEGYCHTNCLEQIMVLA